MNRARLVPCLLLTLAFLAPSVQPMYFHYGDRAAPDPEAPAMPDAPSRDALDDAVHALVHGSCFTENLGQVTNRAVRFYASGDPLSIGLTPDGAIYTLVGDTGSQAGAMRSFVLRFVGATRVEPEGLGILSHRTSAFVGNDPDGWVRGARSFERVVYRGLYPGVDLCFRFENGSMKYEFIVGSSGDPDDILNRQVEAGNRDHSPSPVVGSVHRKQPQAGLSSLENAG